MDAELDVVNVIHIDDDRAVLDVTKRSLKREHPEMEIKGYLRPKDALGNLDDADCIVTDYQMEEMDGLEFLERVRDEHPDVPVIFFTGRGSEEVAGQAFRLGVTDYLQKGVGSQQYVVLGNRISNLVTKHIAEQTADRAAEQVHRIYDRIGEGYVAVDTDWQVTYLNRAAETLLVEGEFDYGADISVWELLGRDAAVEETIREAMSDRKPGSVDCNITELDRWLELRAYPSSDGLSVFLEDLTEEYDTEESYPELEARLDAADSEFRALNKKLSSSLQSR
jgi:FixJ family two-component response regulator